MAQFKSQYLSVSDDLCVEYRIANTLVFSSMSLKLLAEDSTPKTTTPCSQNLNCADSKKDIDFAPSFK